MKVMHCKRKEERDGKTYWMDIGLTVFIKEDGKVSVKDNRTGEFYPAFEPKPRDDAPQAPSRAADPSDMIPF
jgi:hypothetical protein